MPVLSGIVHKFRVEMESTVWAFVGLAIFLEGVVLADLMTGPECLDKDKSPNRLFLLGAHGCRPQYC